MRAYFDRTVPFYLRREPSFDGIEVEVEESVVKNCDDIQKLIKQIEDMIDASAAPEESNQKICNAWADGLKLIFKTRKQDNTRASVVSEGF